MKTSYVIKAIAKLAGADLCPSPKSTSSSSPLGILLGEILEALKQTEPPYRPLAFREH